MQVIEVIRHPRDKAESKYNPDVGVSKEDEERYQKLLSENEDLQRLISQVRTERASSSSIRKFNKSFTSSRILQKEEKIKLLKDRLAEKEAGKGGVSPTPLTQGKDTLIVADFITDAGTSDSAFGGGISIYTRSSRCSQSDIEFSDSYL